jgi:NAD-dependent SIR2 family protein deacetylase
MTSNEPEGRAKDKAYPWHGFLASRSWAPPQKTQHCDEDARPGYQTVKAHEYEDSAEVLQEKVQLLADLMTKSENCLVYSGAGLSTASGIGDYATKSATKFAAKKLSGFAAQPTLGHRALAAMQREGFVQHWIQQNHDGLPQKAGLPQECLNEIHGAWYDPTNPVVPMKGSLRGDLFEDLVQWEHRADLTLSVGTSMCGMNADRVFTTVSEKSISEWKKRGARGAPDRRHWLGGVIIGIQQTQYDSLACLHIFSRIDRVMDLLLKALNIDTPHNTPYVPDIPSEFSLSPGRFLVSYNQRGHLVHPTEDEEEATAGGKTSKNTRTVLDLREGSRVKMVSGPYEGDEGVVTGQGQQGHYRIEFTHTLDYRNCKQVAPYRMSHMLGSWYVEAAVKGTLPEIPVVNVPTRGEKSMKS